jgi:hypothetical protein
LNGLLALASDIPDYANDPQNSVLPIVFKDPHHYFTPDSLIVAGLAGNIRQAEVTRVFNHIYIVLGEILAKKTGQRPEEVVTNVYHSLGMSESWLPAPETLWPSLHSYFGKLEFSSRSIGGSFVVGLNIESSRHISFVKQFNHTSHAELAWAEDSPVTTLQCHQIQFQQLCQRRRRKNSFCPPTDTKFSTEFGRLKAPQKHSFIFLTVNKINGRLII